MKRTGLVFSCTLLLLLQGACSKNPSTAINSEKATNKESHAITHKIEFKNLGTFKGMPPWDLVKDSVIGKEIRAIVPQSQFACMDDLFNYMKDLSMESDGSVTANLDGSHASHFRDAFISVAPSGSVNVVLYCLPKSDTPLDVNAPKQYQLFTNDGVQAAAPKALLDWMYLVGRDTDTVVKADSKERIEMAFADFVQPISPANKPPETITASTQPVLVAKRKSEQIPAQATKSGLLATLTSPELGMWMCVSTKKSLLPSPISALYNGSFGAMVQFIERSEKSQDNREEMYFKYKDERNVFILAISTINGSTVNVILEDQGVTEGKILVNGVGVSSNPTISLRDVTLKQGKLDFSMEIEGTYTTTNTCEPARLGASTKDITG